MRVVLDTSVLIADDSTAAFEAVAVSSVSFAELAFGVHASPDPVERLLRRTRLDRLLEEFGPGLPFDDDAAAAYGQLSGVILANGRNPRARSLDLMIAATAYAADCSVLTRNPDDFSGLERLVPILTP